MKRGPCYGAYSWGHWPTPPASQHPSPHNSHQLHTQGHTNGPPHLSVPGPTHPPAPGHGHSRNVSAGTDIWVSVGFVWEKCEFCVGHGVAWDQVLAMALKT